MFDRARPDLLALAGFAQRYRDEIRPANPLERVGEEIKSCTDVVALFPNPAALLRLAGAIQVEQHDEWEVCDRCYFCE